MKNFAVNVHSLFKKLDHFSNIEKREVNRVRGIVYHCVSYTFFIAEGKQGARTLEVYNQTLYPPVKMMADYSRLFASKRPFGNLGGGGIFEVDNLLNSTIILCHFDCGLGQVIYFQNTHKQGKLIDGLLPILL
jgi:hypothetical protein